MVEFIVDKVVYHYSFNKLWEYVGKRVKIIFKDGDLLEGFLWDYCDEEDNEDGIDSIMVKNKDTVGFSYDVSQNDIISIEIND